MIAAGTKAALKTSLGRIWLPLPKAEVMTRLMSSSVGARDGRFADAMRALWAFGFRNSLSLPRNLPR